MIGVIAGIAIALAAICYWVVGASYVYSRLSGDLFIYPWMQWLDAFDVDTLTGPWNKTKLVIIGSALLPMVFPLGIGRIIYLRRSVHPGEAEERPAGD